VRKCAKEASVSERAQKSMLGRRLTHAARVSHDVCLNPRFCDCECPTCLAVWNNSRPETALPAGGHALQIGPGGTLIDSWDRWAGGSRWPQRWPPLDAPAATLTAALAALLQHGRYHADAPPTYTVARGASQIWCTVCGEVVASSATVAPDLLEGPWAAR
jgi:hypothetical protein